MDVFDVFDYFTGKRRKVFFNINENFLPTKGCRETWTEKFDSISLNQIIFIIVKLIANRVRWCKVRQDYYDCETFVHYWEIIFKIAVLRSLENLIHVAESCVEEKMVKKKKRKTDLMLKENINGYLFLFKNTKTNLLKSP